MEIRCAGIEDTARILELFRELDSCSARQQPEHFRIGERSAEYLRDLICGDDSDFLLCVDNDDIIGFSLIFLKGTKPLSLLIPCRYAYIQDFVITENRRGQGYGTVLLNASREWAKERGAGYLRLSVIPTNDAGIRFYRKNGLDEQMITMECPI